jgi:DNA-3-methyladenine glycosylase II
VIYTTKFGLRPIPPYNFDLSMAIFSTGDPQVRRYEDGKFWKVVRSGRKIALVTVSSRGTESRPSLLVELKSGTRLSPRRRNAFRAVVQSILHLDLDLKPFYRATKNDPVMNALARRLKGLNFPTVDTVFEALVYAICEQQISLAAARSIQYRLIKEFGDRLPVEGKVYFCFPTPKRLAAVSIAKLRRCGLSSNKARAINNLAVLVAGRLFDPEKLKSCPSGEDVVADLMKLRGIGRWTAEYVLIRGLGRLDAVPADDIGIQRSIAHYYCHDKRIDEKKVREIAASWGPWKSPLRGGDGNRRHSFIS